MKTIQSLIRDEQGVTAIEYGLIMALIVMLSLVAIRTAGQSLTQLWNTIAVNFQT